MSRILLSLLATLLSCPLLAQDPVVASAASARPAGAPVAFNPQPLGTEARLRVHMRQADIPSLAFADIRQAGLSFPAGNAAFAPLYAKLGSLLNSADARVNILHLGGSHVQGGTLSNTIRLALATAADTTTGRAFGSTSRGMLFPFKVMNTNAPADYSITPSGKWTSDKNLSRQPIGDLGLAGAVAVTSDPKATLVLDVKNSLWAFTTLRIVGESTSLGCHPVVTVEGQTILPTTDQRPGYLFLLPRSATRCTISFSGLGGGQEFRLRGILPDSDRPGLSYTGAGINGASVPSWLRCTRFEEELPLISPDLVIFGIGINDASGSVEGFSVEAFKQNYRRLIGRIRSVNPQCAFIFITNNDCWYQKQPNKNTPRVEQAFFDLAGETGGAVFNVYRIMGGLGSSDRWVEASYMAGDHIHFTRQGYTLLGNLLANAIITDFEQSQWKK